MDGGAAPYHPRTVDEVFRDFKSRRAAIVKALTADVEEFYQQCDPEKENLCLYGYPNEQWEVNLPAEEVPPELPEPALGINFARDGMQEKDWLALVAVHSDAWLMAVAFYFGARYGFDRNMSIRLSADRKSSKLSNHHHPILFPEEVESVFIMTALRRIPHVYFNLLRLVVNGDIESGAQPKGDNNLKYQFADWKNLFSLMNDLPTVYEVVTGKSKVRTSGTNHSSNKSKSKPKARAPEAQTKYSKPKEEDEGSDEEDLEEEDEHSDALCGACGENYASDEFWICCDLCERWFHGKCVKITPARAEHIKQYKCPSCSSNNKRARP